MKEKSTLDPIEQHVIDKIRKFRINRKLRQQDIADIINSSTSFVGNVENINNPSKYNLKHIRMISEYFEIPPSFFLPDRPLHKEKQSQNKKAY